jgi:hypothetical protein
VGVLEMTAMQKAILNAKLEAQLEERARCANICDQKAKYFRQLYKAVGHNFRAVALEEAAAKIRSGE